MKQLTRDILVSAFMGFAVPGMVLNFASAAWARQTGEIPVMETVTEETIPASLPVRVRQEDGTVREGDMEEYLTGVVLAEMPASFEPEALKAQAVVARTYAWKAYQTGGKHGDGSVCTGSGCCQAYIAEEDYLAKGGTAENVEKIRSAVMATAGEILTYEGAPIEATYFSCSGGSTEDAAAVWGTDYPYLQAVDSPGEENAAYYRDSKTFTTAQVEDALEIKLTGKSSSWIGSVTYTEGGGVDTISIGGIFFTGTEVRSRLDLRSAAFTVAADGDSLTFTTKGYGHRVGMSQYGADAMAVTGSTYAEILAHYYQGTELTKLETEKGESMIN